MQFIQSLSKTRFAIATGASLGVGHTIFQACARNLGPLLGFVAGVTATAAVALVIAASLEQPGNPENEQIRA